MDLLENEQIACFGKGYGQPRSAEHILRRMPGLSRSLLVWDNHSDLWIVKFQKNPQHGRLLINEYLATRIASKIGLSVPRCGIIQVGAELIERSPEASRPHNLREPIYTPGLHFGSAYVGMGSLGKALALLPSSEWHRVENLTEVAGILAFDAWVHHTDRRQAVFVRQGRSRSVKAFWIDHGNCFGAGTWQLDSWNSCPFFRSNPIYQSLRSWDDFEPWLDRIANFDPEELWSIVDDLPACWCSGEEKELRTLLARLLHRRERIKTILLDVIHSSSRLFPLWSPSIRSMQNLTDGDSEKAWREAC